MIARRARVQLGLLVLLALLVVPGATVISCAAARRPGAEASSATAGGRALAPAPDEAFRLHPPAAEPRPTYVPPVPHRTLLPNGMELLVVERHITQLVTAELVVRGGTAAFPSEPPEAFYLMADTAVSGTQTLSEFGIYDEMNHHVFELHTSVGDAWLSFRIRAMSRFLNAALETMHDVALRPTFPADHLAVRQQRRQTSAARMPDDAGWVARQNMFAALYGRSHPYTRAVSDDPAVLAKLTRDDIVRVWKESLDPAQATLVVVGDVDEAALRVRVEALFGDWIRDSSLLGRAPVPAPAPDPKSARLVVIDRPGVPQATLYYGGGISSIDAPAHLAEWTLDILFGGLRSSALDDQLRNQLGAFGDARMYARPGGGILWWQGSVAPAQVGRALEALDHQLRDLRASGPDAGQLATAKSIVLGGLPREMETVEGVGSDLAQIAAYHLPLDQIATFRARVTAVSSDAVRAAVPDPAAMKAVVVGDLATLRGPLLALGWGPLEEHDAKGKLVRVIAAEPPPPPSPPAQAP